MISILSCAVFIETVIQAIKPVYDPTTKRFAFAELLSMAFGVVLAIACRINLLADFFTPEDPLFSILLCVLSGIILGRGPSFVHDLWTKLKTTQKY